ncbi:MULTISPECIES: glucose-6-phosphate isomerase [Brevundimonas]|uniref:glucose-6-phosphate isomerase n=1 Tax=Brevundimonas sp. 357 TaxID=2555782 RepID=UPI000F76A162|nr:MULTISPECIES: glucose-6-phosphate isomerase [Brevundimonas]RSB48077.1 glucose-6-phosphate isomerase [Brevundimonas sp. 357]
MPHAAWAELEAAARRDADARIQEQFTADPDRLTRLTLDVAGLHIDLSKQSWTQAGLKAALALARACDVEGRRAALFNGEAVNLTEGRAVLHPALRAPDGAAFHALGEPVSAEVEAVRAEMKAYAEALRSGNETGASGRPFKTVLHIGIGGSDLGPRLIWDALRPLDPAIDLRFVANIDPRDMAEALIGLDPETTLVIVVSKSFTTQETLLNAQAAKAWLAAALPAEGMAKHFIGVTAAPDKAAAFGCGRTFAFRDWVGGRYSLWSAVSLSCVIGLGWDAFQGFLDGAAALDRHFLEAPLERNAPVMLALAEIYNVDGLHRPARTVAPYAHALRRLPAFLQQLEMESNGKRVRCDGSPVGRQTCPIVFGEAGTNGQHAFFQQIHQGPQVVPSEFIIVASTNQRTLESPLWANALAQAQALMQGKTEAQARTELIASGASEDEADRLAPHKTFPGNRPSTAILMERLTPQTLGALIALYEHKTFVEGVLWDINSFDQWGVELGKVLAKALLKDAATGTPSADLDPSTADLLRRLTA